MIHLGHGYWHQITLGHVNKHHLGALRLLAVAVGGSSLEMPVVTVTAIFLRGATVVRVIFLSRRPHHPSWVDGPKAEESL